MKRKLSISFVTVATLLLILFAIVPHHHHNGVITCMVLEVCDNHDPITEDHHRHHSADDIDHEENCISDAAYITRSYEGKAKCCLSDIDPAAHLHLFPVIHLIADFLLYPEPEKKPDGTDGLIIHYQSIDVSRIHGLRAPPLFLS